MVWKCLELKKASKVHSSWSSKGILKFYSTINERANSVMYENGIVDRNIQGNIRDTRLTISCLLPYLFCLSLKIGLVFGTRKYVSTISRIGTINSYSFKLLFFWKRCSLFKWTGDLSDSFFPFCLISYISRSFWRIWS